MNPDFAYILKCGNRYLADGRRLRFTTMPKRAHRYITKLVAMCAAENYMKRTGKFAEVIEIE